MPAEGVERRTRARQVVGNLRDVWVCRWVNAYRRPNCWERERVVRAAHDRCSIRRHCQRSAQIATAEQAVWSIMIGWVAKIELKERVGQPGLHLQRQRRTFFHVNYVLRPQILEQIRLAGKKSSEQSVEVGCYAPHESADSGSPVIVTRIGDEFHRRRRNPSGESVLTRPNGVPCRSRPTPAGWRDVLPDVFRDDRVLEDGVVKLLRRTCVEPEYSGRGIRSADGIDVGDH